MNAAVLERRHRFSVEEWLRLDEIGLFPPEYRGELIDGAIVDAAPVTPLHSGCLAWLHRRFSVAGDERYIVSTKQPLVLGDFSCPQPDLALLQYRADFYRMAHPGPAETFLVVELADTTLRFDREVKAPLYARFGIPEYWLVNLPEQCVEVYRQPQAGGYQSVARLERRDTLVPLAWPELQVAIEELLG